MVQKDYLDVFLQWSIHEYVNFVIFSADVISLTFEEVNSKNKCRESDIKSDMKVSKAYNFLNFG